MLQSLGTNIWSLPYQTKMSIINFDCKSFIIKSEEKLVIISPGPWNEAIGKELQTIGQVASLVAPNAFHHIHLTSWISAYPTAEVWGVRPLLKKRPEIAFSGFMKDQVEPFGKGLSLHPIWGAAGLSEVVFFHQPSESLIVTDLLFNVTQVRGFFSNLSYRLLGIHKKLGSSRLLKSTVADKEKFAKSIAELLQLDFSQVLINHGENLTEQAKQQFALALQWVGK